MSKTNPAAAADSPEREEDGRAMEPERPEANLNLELVMDIPVTLSLEVGRTRLSVRQLLQLGRGAVIELDRLAGEPMDVKVNGVLVAHGEVVVVNEKFGIRLTDVVRPSEWIRKLK